MFLNLHARMIVCEFFNPNIIDQHQKNTLGNGFLTKLEIVRFSVIVDVILKIYQKIPSICGCEADRMLKIGMYHLYIFF